MNKPFPARCVECKHSRPEERSAWNLLCMHPNVNAKDSFALGAASIQGTECRSERKRGWFAPCGRRGALWEAKEGEK